MTIRLKDGAARSLTVKILRALGGVTALVAAILAGSCKEQAPAAKEDFDKQSLYGRIDAIRTSYTSGVQRGGKQDLMRREALIATVPDPEAAPQTGQPAIHTASLFTAPRLPSSRYAKTTLVAFQSAPFPYDGAIGRSSSPFLNISENGRRGHRTQFNRVYWEEDAYSDPRVLLHIPRGFDTAKPGVMVLFFHGHGAKLERDVLRRQQVPRQISESGANAVLVAPQLAVDARDSSIGKFWEPGGVKRFLNEAAIQLAQLYGDIAVKPAFAKMPVVIIAYSGGYVPAAWAISHGGLGKRLQGVVLLDALYGETEKFTGWISNLSSGFFVSAYANSTRGRNQDFERLLTQLNIPVRSQIGPRLGQGSVVLIPTAEDTDHRDFVTKAWTEYPIKDLLRRMALLEGKAL
jgi:hypothetical protein